LYFSYRCDSFKKLKKLNRNPEKNNRYRDFLKYYNKEDNIRRYSHLRERLIIKKSERMRYIDSDTITIIQMIIFKILLQAFTDLRHSRSKTPEISIVF